MKYDATGVFLFAMNEMNEKIYKILKILMKIFAKT